MSKSSVKRVILKSSGFQALSSAPFPDRSRTPITQKRLISEIAHKFKIIDFSLQNITNLVRKLYKNRAQYGFDEKFFVINTDRINVCQTHLKEFLEFLSKNPELLVIEKVSLSNMAKQETVLHTIKNRFDCGKFTRTDVNQLFSNVYNARQDYNLPDTFFILHKQDVRVNENHLDKIMDFLDQNRKLLIDAKNNRSK